MQKVYGDLQKWGLGGKEVRGCGGRWARLYPTRRWRGRLNHNIFKFLCSEIESKTIWSYSKPIFCDYSALEQFVLVVLYVCVCNGVWGTSTPFMLFRWLSNYHRLWENYPAKLSRLKLKLKHFYLFRASFTSQTHFHQMGRVWCIHAMSNWNAI